MKQHNLLLETFARFVIKGKKSKNEPLGVEKFANNGILDCIFRLDWPIFSSFSQLLRIEQRSLILFITLTLLTACGEQQNTAAKQAPSNKQTEAAEQNESSKQPTNNEQTDTPSNDTANGTDAPLEFSLTNLDGELVNAADYRGKWLVLNYWATWCAPCRDEMPELVKFQNTHDNVQILGIAYEDAEIHKLKSFAADFNVNYPLLTIDVYNPPKFAEEGGLGLPTTIVYNPEGLRHKKHMGPIDAEGLAELLE